MKAQWEKRLSLSRRRNGFETESTLADLLMAIKLRSAGGLRVVRVPHSNIDQADACLDQAYGLLIAFGTYEIVAGDVTMACIETGPDRDHRFEAPDEFGNLVETAAKREFGSGSVFDQDVKVGALETDAVSCFGDGLGSETEAVLAREAAARARVQDEILRAQGQRALHFAAEGGNGFRADLRRLAAEVHQVAGVNHQRRAVIFAAQGAHLFAVGWSDPRWTPHARARREDLKSIRANFMGVFGGFENAARG